MIMLIGGYTSFEEQFLMAVYYASNRLERDEASFADIQRFYSINENPRWLNRALSHFVEAGWAEGPLMLGNAHDLPVELTALGLRQAEKLIEENRFFLQTTDGLGSIQVPAADRVVTLDHNRVLAAEQPISQLIEAIEADNGDPDEPGLREQLLGEIKAGRELVRAGSFRAYLLYETLVRALNALIARYKNPALVELSKALLGAVVSQLIQG